MKRVTAAKKYRAKLADMKVWLKRGRNKPLKKLMAEVAAKLNGHYQYYGVTDNYRGIARFRQDVQKLLYKWLNRRSQRRSFCWEEYHQMLHRFPLPNPQIRVSLYYRRYKGLFGEPCA